MWNIFKKRKYLKKIKEENIKIDTFTKDTFEPLKSNRYIVVFPKKYSIPQFVSRTVCFMEDKIVKISFMEGVGTVYADRFKQMKCVGDIKIKLLDPYNTQVMGMDLTKVKVIHVIPHDLYYNSDNIWGFDVIFKYGDIEYSMIEKL